MDQLGFGMKQRIEFATNLGADKVAVHLSTDGGETFPYVLASNIVASAKAATVTIPAFTGSVTNARVRVEWLANPATGGSSPMDFSIQPAYLRIRAPNGPLHAWKTGTTQTVTWTGNLGTPEKVRLDLSLNGGVTYPITLVASTNNDGAHPVTVQAGWATTAARVKVTSLTSGAVLDVSNENFRIQ